MVRNRDSAFIKDRTFNILNPIVNSSRDGLFKMSTTSIEKYRSNLYTLIFTGIGERVMEPEFGTRVKYMLFEPLTTSIYEAIKGEIKASAARYIPEIRIDSISFGDELEDAENNKVSMKIDFSLKLDPTIQDFIEIEMGT